MTVKVLDIFSGIGGFSYGLNQAGFETVAFCEIEQPCINVLNKHWPDLPVYSDIRKLSPSTFNQKIDVVCGGFPCQDISIAGKGVGIEGEKSGLWTEFARIIEEFKPKYAIIENVSALLGRGLNVVLRDLSEIGYDACYTTLDAKYCGTPQRRRRVYIVAVRDGIPADADIFKFDERYSDAHTEKMESVQKGFTWDFATGGGVTNSFTYLTRQRSDQFSETGLSSTLAKRDYKSFTDLVVSDGNIRRVTPEERLRLQGFPSTWFEECGLSLSDQFRFNGMHVPSVRWIGQCVKEFDNEYV